MARAGDADLVEGQAEDGAQQGHHRVGLEVAKLSLEPRNDLRWIAGLERVRPERASDPAHDCRSPQSAARHIADHGAQLTRWQHEDVVPVAADVSCARNIARRHREPWHGRKIGWQQAALQRGRGRPVKLSLQRLDRQRRPVRRQLEQVDIVAR